MKGLNWTRQNNKSVWYENEPMQIVLSLRPIDEEPPDYILETKDGEHLKVNLLNRKLLYYKKGTVTRYYIQPKTHCSQLAYFTSKRLENKNAPNSQKNINKH